MHRHHILPKRLGGTDDEENLTPPISIELHAEFHRDLWEHYGDKKDYIAWKALSGRKVKEECRLASAKIGQENSDLYKQTRKLTAEILKKHITHESRSLGGKQASKKLVEWQKANAELHSANCSARAKANAYKLEIPHQYKGIVYKSKKELQLATKLSNTGFYNKLKNGDIQRLPKK